MVRRTHTPVNTSHARLDILHSHKHTLIYMFSRTLPVFAYLNCTSRGHSIIRELPRKDGLSADNTNVRLPVATDTKFSRTDIYYSTTVKLLQRVDFYSH